MRNFVLAAVMLLAVGSYAADEAKVVKPTSVTASAKAECPVVGFFTDTVGGTLKWVFVDKVGGGVKVGYKKTKHAFYSFFRPSAKAEVAQAPKKVTSSK